MAEAKLTTFVPGDYVECVGPSNWGNINPSNLGVVTHSYHLTNTFWVNIECVTPYNRSEQPYRSQNLKKLSINEYLAMKVLES